MNRYKNATKISFEEYNDIEECDCRKPVFKYTDTTRNISVLKCATSDREFIPKTKEWIYSKRVPCKLFCIYVGDTPEYPITIVRKTLATVIDNQEDRNKALTDKLAMLFKFAKLTTRTSVMDEINYLVKTKLQRQPRKIYYFPTTSLFMKVSHHEPIEEYHNRIFSVPIVDLTFVPPPPPAPTTPKAVNKKKKKVCSFIETTDDIDDIVDSTSENSDSEDSDSEREEQSDYSDLSDQESVDGDAESVIEEEQYEEEYDDGGDYSDHSDY